MAVSLLICVLMITSFVDCVLQLLSNHLLLKLGIVKRDRVHNIIIIPQWITSIQLIALIAAISGLFLVHEDMKFLFTVYLILVIGARILLNMNYVSRMAYLIYNIVMFNVTFTILVQAYHIHKEYIIHMFMR